MKAMDVLKKNVKNRQLLVALAMVFLLSGFLSNSIVAVTPTESYAGNQLRTLGILKGYSDGDLHLANRITRSEVATMMVRVLAEEPVSGQVKQFSDLTDKHWSYPYVQEAYRLEVIHGYPDGRFAPDNPIAYAEVVAIMVNTLGYHQQVQGQWPNNYMEKAKELKIIPQDSQVPATKIVTRGEMALIVWDTLLAKKYNKAE